MAASAFQDGNLKPGGREPQGDRDALTVLDLPLRVGVPRDSSVAASETAVENSAVGPLLLLP
ncbi:hypothetical protein AB0I81_55320 [Nonomuraea sp. NPDC050404]|uniref:hypothetical protein n=1 Tax=Nonomuraea sp. NPDC050404 TaxID=3155783 RepID=UPI0033F20763